MNNRELFYFAAKCLMLDEHPEFADVILAKINDDSIDWSKFVHLCSNHLILPAIYLKFRRAALISQLPSDLAEFLHEIYELNAERNKQILDQINYVNVILNKHNISPLYLKGAAHLLESLYSDPGERILGDIDFLVPEKDYLPTAQLLEKEGYKKYEGHLSYFDPDMEKHYPRLSKTGFPANIEIHRLITEAPLRWFNAQTIDLHKKQAKEQLGCFVPSGQDLIIHNFVHSQISHGGHTYLTISLRDIYDLHLLSKETSLIGILQNIGQKKKAIAYFSFAESVFGLKKSNFGTGKFSTWFLKARHDLNQTSNTFYYINRIIAFLRYKIVERYYVQGLGFIRTKKMRKAVFKRLLDPVWHKERLKELKNLLSVK